DGTTLPLYFEIVQTAKITIKMNQQAELLCSSCKNTPHQLAIMLHPEKPPSNRLAGFLGAHTLRRQPHRQAVGFLAQTDPVRHAGGHHQQVATLTEEGEHVVADMQADQRAAAEKQPGLLASQGLFVGEAGAELGALFAAP